MEKSVAPQNSIEPGASRSLSRRLSPWLVIAFWMAFATFRFGLNINSLVWFAALLCLGTALWIVENRSSRPAKTFYRVALLSVVLALLFIGMPLANHGETVMGVIGWVGTTLLATIWAIHYERTEPRP